MAITAKDREHVIMGEAAMNIILRNKEVTVATLIRQLNAMSGDEPDGGRLAAIKGACRWLLDFRQPGSLSQQGSPWFASPGAADEGQPQGAEDDIIIGNVGNGRSS